MRNWAGNHAYRARAVHRPRSTAELAEVLQRAGRIRVLGSRHSFSDIADADELTVLDDLGGDVVVEDGSVSVPAPTTYGVLCAHLDRAGRALHAMASLPHISVGGAVATATHGSGDRAGNLATAVRAVELVTSEGAVVTVARGDEDFDGMVVGLGSLGAVTRLTLDVEPAYEVRQHVFLDLPWHHVEEHLDAVTGAGASVSLFTTWGDAVDQVWVKQRADEPVVSTLFGASRASEAVHPVAGLDPSACTEQLGLPGPWWARLPHFRMEHTPSSGRELQSEYHVARADGPAAIASVRAIAAAIRPVLQVSEIRTVAADALWMSPQFGRDTLAIHFTWTDAADDVLRAVRAVETVLAPLEPRPHWGKVFTTAASDIARAYERRADFVRLAERLDPRGAFRNPWFDRYILGERE